MVTIREHIDAIIGDREVSAEADIRKRDHAVAALKILTASEPYQRGATYGDACRVVADPEGKA